MTKEEARLILQENFGLLSFEYPGRISDAIKIAIKVLSQPPFPSNLDEAAEEYEDWATSFDQTDYPTCISYRMAFKAGAEWMQNNMFTERYVNEPFDSAARDVFKDWIPMEVLQVNGGNIPLYNAGALLMMFDAGVKWRNAQIPKPPNDVDAAANTYAYSNFTNNQTKAASIRSFKAGAEWMSEQGKIIECVVEDNNIGFQMASPFEREERVIIQIRKKDV